MDKSLTPLGDTQRNFFLLLYLWQQDRKNVSTAEYKQFHEDLEQ